MPSKRSAAACGGSGGARAPSIWISCATATAPWANRSSPSRTPNCRSATSGGASSPSSTPSPCPMPEDRKPVTAYDLVQMKQRGERIVVLTCYDALFARLLDASGVDLLLGGGSVNQVLGGAEGTPSPTLEQMSYQTKNGRRARGARWGGWDVSVSTDQVPAHRTVR